MTIHQMQIRADEREDRLLLRLSTTDGCEYRFWLTRRFVKQLWGLLLKMVEWDKAVQQQFGASMRQTVLEIQHEGYAQQGDFSKGFEDAPRTFPLGQTPVLLCSGKGVRRDNGLYVLSLYPAQGQGLDMTLDTRLLHIFGKILRDAVARADWGIALALGEKAPEPGQAETQASRKLN
jgi:citrate lyase gamma subunit